MFSVLFCRNSGTFDWATVSLECRTGQAYWRSGTGRIAVQKQILVKWARECSKIRISRPQNEKFYKDGHCCLSKPLPFVEDGTETPILAPHSSPLALDLAPLNANPGSAPDVIPYITQIFAEAIAAHVYFCNIVMSRYDVCCTVLPVSSVVLF